MKIVSKLNGDLVRKSRENLIMNKKEFAEAVGITFPTLKNMESGGIVSKETAEKVAAYLGKDIKELFEVK